MLIFTNSEIIKKFPQRNPPLECQFVCLSRLMHMSVAASAQRIRESKDISCVCVLFSAC